MKLPTLLGTAWLALAPLMAHGQVALSRTFNGANLDVPDTGLMVGDTREVTTGYGSLLEVRLTMTLVGTGDGAWNGDYYAILSHAGKVVVLLNRVGRRDGSTFGYGDDGFSAVTFDDSAPMGDVHN